MQDFLVVKDLNALFFTSESSLLCHETAGWHFERRCGDSPVTCYFIVALPNFIGMILG